MPNLANMRTKVTDYLRLCEQEFRTERDLLQLPEQPYGYDRQYSALHNALSVVLLKETGARDIIDNMCRGKTREIAMMESKSKRKK